MKFQDLLSVVDLSKIKLDDLEYLRRHVLQSPRLLTDEEMWLMYGDEIGELKVQQQRADLARTRAEIVKFQADAKRARADADAQRVGTSRRS